MSRIRSFLGGTVIVIVVLLVAFATGVLLARTGPGGIVGVGGDTARTARDAPAGRPYPGDPEREAGLVRSERERLSFVTTLAGSVPWRIDRVDGAFRVPTAPLPTLVLPARTAPYTIDDLQALTPDGFARQPDGSFLLSEHIVVLPDATLDLSGARALDMASTPDAFASIVVEGGALTITGDADAPVTVSSFDPATGRADTSTSDGRAYVRVAGGTVHIDGAAFTALGFWSGDTGGLSFTGSSEADEPPALGTAPEGGHRGDAAVVTPDEITGVLEDRSPGRGQVSGSISNVSVAGNAYGIFLSGVSNLTVADSRIEGSLVDGLVLHRDVTDTEVSRTTTTQNAVDGLVVDRSSRSIALTDVSSSRNGRNGVSIDLRPLALGPNPSGAPAHDYGDVSVTGSWISGNERYGIEVAGGSDIAISGSDFAAGIVGVVVDRGATAVSIADSTFSGQERQSIALRDGAEDVTVTGNRIASVETGVRVEDATGTIERNEFLAIQLHAVTLAGTAAGTRVVHNTISGQGTTPISDQAIGGYSAANDTEGWERPITPKSVVQTLGQPLTLIWVTLGLIVLLTAVLRRPKPGIKDPYPEHLPLTQLSRGIVPVESVRRKHS